MCSPDSASKWYDKTASAAEGSAASSTSGLSTIMSPLLRMRNSVPTCIGILISVRFPAIPFLHAARWGPQASLPSMRFARVKAGREADLLEAIERGRLGEGSVAEGEYLRNMKDARLCEDQ